MDRNEITETIGDTLRQIGNGKSQNDVTFELVELFLANQPKAGTSAYELIGAAAAAEVETTESLMQMLAATILTTLIEEEGTGRSNISYSPASMDHMMKNYTFTTEKDSMKTTVRIEMKPDSDLRNEKSWRAPSNRHEIEDVSDAKPQAEPKVYDRPIWAIRWAGQLYEYDDRASAEKDILNRDDGGIPAQIENRMCMHLECPDSVCNKK